MAELYATYRALLFIQQQPPLLGLPKCFTETPQTHPGHLVMIGIVCQVSHLHNTGKLLVFCWIPGDMGLPINEAASAATKKASLCGDLTLNRLYVEMFLPVFFMLFICLAR
jgi:hypothetical protein